MRRTFRPRRAAFTMVELLVAMTIVALLSTIAVVGITKFRDSGDQAQARGEITQLAQSIESFKSRFNVNYMPSSINMTSPEGIQYMSKLFPRAPAATWASLGTLTSPQCLVFFLAGRGPNFEGFSTNPTDPLAPGGSRIGPFFDFPSSRLANPTAVVTEFKDPFGTNYIYFSSWKSGNDYNHFGGFGGVNPYRESTNHARFANAHSFQIISAGKDGQFGSGGTNWQPGATTGEYARTGRGFDDMSNFHPTLLGVAP